MRAKFQVYETTESMYDQTKVVMVPVAGGGNPENEQFFATTPAGKLEITIKNPVTRTFLKVGKSYYLDFTEANDED